MKESVTSQNVLSNAASDAGLLGLFRFKGFYLFIVDSNNVICDVKSHFNRK